MSLPPLTTRAQFVAAGVTNSLSNVTNSRPVAIVGTNGSFTLLVLSNNAPISSTYLGAIGQTKYFKITTTSGVAVRTS